MDLRTGSLLAGQLHSVRHGSFLALRVEQPPSVPCRIGRSGESVLCVQQFLVHHRYIPETRIRTQPQGSCPNRCYFCVHSFTAALDRGRDEQRLKTHNKIVSCCKFYYYSYVLALSLNRPHNLFQAENSVLQWPQSWFYEWLILFNKQWTILKRRDSWDHLV